MLDTGGAALGHSSELTSKTKENPHVGIREANMLI